MKIMFLAPPIQEGKVPTEYTEIIEAAKKLGHSLENGYLMKDGFTLGQYHNAVSKAIKISDAVVVDGTTLTVETSRFISFALQCRLPVLLLYKKNNPQAQIFEASRFLSLKKYDADSLERILQSFFKKITKKQLLYRFNLMLSREMDSFVMEKSQGKKVSKADYIRDLILRDMDK